jgi:hypothetical protein
MRQVQSASALRKASGIHKFASLDHPERLTWRKVSPSAHLMVDPRSGARAVIRDTGAEAGRYLWSVLAAGETYPFSEGRIADLAQAESIAEAALHAYTENSEPGVVGRHFADGREFRPLPD